MLSYYLQLTNTLGSEIELFEISCDITKTKVPCLVIIFQLLIHLALMLAASAKEMKKLLNLLLA
jgi:hypothetical protein